MILIWRSKLFWDVCIFLHHSVKIIIDKNLYTFYESIDNTQFLFKQRILINITNLFFSVSVGIFVYILWSTMEVILMVQSIFGILCIYNSWSCRRTHFVEAFLYSFRAFWHWTAIDGRNSRTIFSNAHSFSIGESFDWREYERKTSNNAEVWLIADTFLVTLCFMWILIIHTKSM